MEISSTLSNMGLREEEGINKLGGQSPTCEGWGSSLAPSLDRKAVPSTGEVKVGGKRPSLGSSTGRSQVTGS